MSIFIGRWDCNLCGHRGNLGNVIHCSQCNAPRGKDVEFYLPDNTEIVTNQIHIDEANAGADWVCSYCESANKATLSHCASCGNERSLHEDKSLLEQEYSLENQPKTSEDAKILAKQQKERIREQKKQAQNQQTGAKTVFDTGANRKKNIVIGILTLVLTILLSFIAFLYIPYNGENIAWNAIRNFSSHNYAPSLLFQQALHQQKEEIIYDLASFSWQRTISIQKGEDVSYEGWDIPAGGKQTSSRSEIHHYDDVPDGYDTKTRSVRVASGTRRYACGTKSKGNGYFETKYCTETTYTNKTETYSVPRYRKVARYATKYTYTIREWRFDHDEITKAQDNKPHWASYSAAYKGDKWRESGRTELYMITIKAPKYEAMYDFDLATWQHLITLKQFKLQQNIAAFAPEKAELLKIKDIKDTK